MACKLWVAAIGVDFFEKENSGGATIFMQALFSIYRVCRKNEPLCVKYFLSDYKLKISKFYSQGWAILFI